MGKINKNKYECWARITDGTKDGWT